MAALPALPQGKKTFLRRLHERAHEVGQPIPGTNASPPQLIVRHDVRRRAVHEIIYLIGLIVVISFLLSLLGFR